MLEMFEQKWGGGFITGVTQSNGKLMWPPVGRWRKKRWTHLGFDDDLILLAQSKLELRDAYIALHECCAVFGLEIAFNKCCFSALVSP
jgi:hypothetical protein